jgi:hypothetical protein
LNEDEIRDLVAFVKTLTDGWQFTADAARSKRNAL